MKYGEKKLKLGEKLSLLKFLMLQITRFDRSYLPFRTAYTIFQIITPLAVPVIPALILDELMAHSNLSRLLMLIAAAVLISALTALANYIFGRALERSALLINQGIERSLSDALMAIDYASCEDPEVKDMGQIARDTTNRASGLDEMAASLFTLLGTGVALLGMVAILLSFAGTDRVAVTLTGAAGYLAQNGVLCLLIAGALCVLSAFMDKLLMNVYSHYDADFARLGRMYRYYGNLSREEAYAKDIRLFGLSELVGRQTDSYRDENAQLLAKVNVYENSLMAIKSVLLTLSMMLVIATVSCKVLGGSISVGEFYMYTAAVTQLINLIKQLGTTLSSIDRSLTYQRAYRDILNLAAQGPSMAQNAAQDALPPAGDIVLEHVTFTYPGSTVPVLEDVSMTIRRGEKLALVGRNGAGKTTIIKLLLGLYAPDSGRILYGGRDIRTLDTEQYAALFGTVFQDGRLLATSLADNVALMEHPDVAEVERCLAKAALADMPARLSRGLDTPIQKRLDSNGVELSGGEAQKVLIARAMYQNAPILIMDEPTAALDPLSEESIYNVVRTSLEADTAVFISHRLSSCRLCDRILVLDGGHIVQDGSHDRLVREDGLYAMLWEAQSSLYA